MFLKKLFFPIAVTIVLAAGSAAAVEYVQVAGLIDTRSTYSDGALDVESLAALAKSRGFEALFFNDHDRLVMEYGLFPLENLLKRREELNSINKAGAENYLAGIKEAEAKYPDMILVPGSETVPFYYWKGSYFKKNLTAHDHEKRILTIGLETPADYENLPIIHNGFSTRYVKRFLPGVLIFAGAFVLGIVLIMEGGAFRVAGIVVGAASLLLLVNTSPFRSSPFDQYHGDRGAAPYQLLVDYVDAKGGMTFWNYPETRSGVRELGPIFLNTQPYPEVLERTFNYTGFSALYGDAITVTEPGREWDRVLQAYCRGERNRPVWGIATADFHREGEPGQRLGDYPTVFLVRSRTKKEVLSAMREGRMYACRGDYPQRVVLKEFSVCGTGCENRATLGQEARLKGKPRIRISLELKVAAANRASVRLIRSGEVIRTFEGALPMDIDVEDNLFEPGRKAYYRFDVKGPGALVSNPVFVTFTE